MRMVFVAQHDDRVSPFASRHWYSVARGACVLHQRDRRNPKSARAGDLTRCDGKVERDSVTLGDEVKGQITFVKEGHDVEHVTAVLKKPYRNVF